MKPNASKKMFWSLSSWYIKVLIRLLTIHTLYTCYSHKRDSGGGPWAEKYVHLSARTTQSVEGAHANIKANLRKSGLMMHLFETTHNYLLAAVISVTTEKF